MFPQHRSPRAITASRDQNARKSVAGPPPDAVRKPWPFHSDASDAIISHRDTGPWHTVARGGKPVAYIDWTSAGPTDRLDDIAERNDLPGAASRAGQLRLFLDGYGLPADDRQGLVTRMIECAIRDGAGVVVKARITPETLDATPLWALAWQARAAACFGIVRFSNAPSPADATGGTFITALTWVYFTMGLGYSQS